MPTTNFKNAVTKNETNKAFLTLLKLEHIDWASPLYLVDDILPVTSNGQLYTPYSFSFTLPKAGTTANPKSSLVISDVDKILTGLTRSIIGEIQFTISVILSDAPDVLELGPYSLDITFMTLSGSEITYEVEKKTVLENKLIGYNMDSVNFPGLFF